MILASKRSLRCLRQLFEVGLLGFAAWLAVNR